MQSPPSSRRAVMAGLLAAALLVGLAGLQGIGASVPSPSFVHTSGSTQSVSLSVDTSSGSFAFVPSSFEVTPGDTVTVTVTQLGTLVHTFTLSPAANYSFDPSTNSTGDLLAFFAAHKPLASVNISGTPGATTSVTFTAPATGVYEFVCLEPGHFQSGMYGFMGSGVSVGGGSTAQVPVGLYIIAGVIVVLVVLAIVLGFVVGQRKGSRYEMPPERLGYPEPPAPGETPPPARPPH